MSVEPRYSRNIGALTEAEFALLRTKKVFVAGCGGLGGHIIDMLLRLGVGSITAIDGDVFDETNLNRQLLCDERVLGRKKAEVAAEYAARVNSSVAFYAVDDFLTAENGPALIAGHDVVIDALDNIDGRKILARNCAALGIPLVHGAIRGWYAQVAVILPGDDTMERLYPEGTKVSDKTCLAFTPALCAALQVSACVKLLCGRGTPHGKLLIADLLEQEFDEILI